MKNDPVFFRFRSDAEFQSEILEAGRLESRSRDLLHQKPSPVLARLFRPIADSR
jgi:hypothetical protein